MHIVKATIKMELNESFYAVTPPVPEMEQELIRKGYKLLDPDREESQCYTVVHVGAKKFWYTTPTGIEFIRRLSKLILHKEMNIIELEPEHHE